MQKPTPFLMFDGQAEQAMKLYISVFANSEILSLTYYGPDEAGAEGSVRLATFSINGQRFICIDSNIRHRFTFTPSISIYIDCDSEPEIDQVFETLSRGGQIFMPLDRYPFSQKFVWFADQFGVSWQLSLAYPPRA